MDHTLMPGFGGKVRLTVRALDAAPEATISDVIDCSRCAVNTYTVVSQTEGGAFSVQAKESFDGVNWSNVGGAITAVGQRGKRQLTGGPFGLLRFDVTFDDSDSAESPSSSSDSVPVFVPATTEIVIDVLGWPIELFG